MSSRGIPAEDSAKLQAWLSDPEFLLDWNTTTYWEDPATLKNLPPNFCQYVNKRILRAQKLKMRLPLMVFQLCIK